MKLVTLQTDHPDAFRAAIADIDWRIVARLLDDFDGVALVRHLRSVLVPMATDVEAEASSAPDADTEAFLDRRDRARALNRVLRAMFHPGGE